MFHQIKAQNCRSLFLIALLIPFAMGCSEKSGNPTGPLDLPGGCPWVPSVASVTGNHVNDVTFPDEYTGIAVGASGTILRTTDAGNTWLIQSSGTSNRLNAVSFTDANTGTVVGDDGLILRTIDGGQTWLEQDSGVTSVLYGVSQYFVDKKWR